MDFKTFSEKFAEEISGEYREYDNNQSIIIVPLQDGRFQTVTGHLSHNTDYDRRVVQIKSRVCSLSEFIPYEELLMANATYPYAKFIVEDGFLKVEAIAFLESVTEEFIKEMIIETARHADNWEYKITGKDIH